MQISDNKCQFLTLNGGLNDKKCACYICSNEVPNAQIIRGLGLLVGIKLLFDPYCLCVVRKFFLFGRFHLQKP